VLGGPFLQWFQLPERSADLVGECRAIQFDLMSRKDLALPVQRQAIADRIRKAEQMSEMGAYAYPSCRP